MKNNRNILVVDDFETNILLLQNILQEAGFNVKSAYSGYEAMEIIRKESLDLILLDILMPGISGMEVLELLKSNDKTRSIPVIMVTAIHEIKSVRNAMSIGAKGYIKKPINKDELLFAITETLQTKSPE
ncbi:MAG: hypothetical protein A2W91_02590 [Bacteroidetes bacterium GWF2_38_335]|nr:MAG: hypothetical protein A2W91_02590 [Bacteroidetes bacterium GWF2_38_335]OFY77616.1 MAG: hypothetical protein A2281_02170 [Bacteroidetes bacterium RIFOXYA12_FULL_38_20]HBS87080.1 hypothetical protein [Bacteroidales bacterium]